MSELRIALIHATDLAMRPIDQAFEELWPEAKRMNLLDDALPKDLSAAGSLNAEMHSRIKNLALYALSTQVDGILYTCSAFGPAIDAARQELAVPVLKPNEAMFDEALNACDGEGQCRIGLVTTFAPATASMKVELEAAAASRGLDVVVEVANAEGALSTLNSGDPATHDALVLDAARRVAHCNVILMGQFSMARTQPFIAAQLQKVVLSSPQSAVRKMKAALTPNHLS